MRSVCMVLAAILLFGCCHRGFGQGSGCTNYFNDGDVVCANGGDCVTQTPAGGDDYYAQGYSCTYIQCCGQKNSQYPFCAWDGSQCYWTKLGDPNIKQQMLELAESQQVLILSCHGLYEPLTTVLAKDEPVFKPRPISFRQLFRSGS